MRAFQSSAMVSALASAVAVFGFASCSTTVASAPAQPAYDVDVRPILMAHCARCHGAGDALNVHTEPTGPDAAVLPNIKTLTGMFRGFHCFLDRYPADNGQCAQLDGGGISASCRFGALYWAKTHDLSSDVDRTSGPRQMPPPPAPPLDDWEKQVIRNWEQNPICSNSPNPDPTICPPDAGT